MTAIGAVGDCQRRATVVNDAIGEKWVVLGDSPATVDTGRKRTVDPWYIDRALNAP